MSHGDERLGVADGVSRLLNTLQVHESNKKSTGRIEL